MKSINKLVIGSMLGLMATTSMAWAQAFEGQQPPNIMQQLEQTTSSSEYQTLASKGYSTEGLLIATLIQIMQLKIEHIKSNVLLQMQLEELKKTNAFLETMITGSNHHGHDMG